MYPIQTELDPVATMNTVRADVLSTSIVCHWIYHYVVAYCERLHPRSMHVDSFR